MTYQPFMVERDYLFNGISSLDGWIKLLDIMAYKPLMVGLDYLVLWYINPWWLG